MTPPPSLQALFSLLEDEKLALLSGEYHMLEEFSQSKQRHLEALDLQHVPRSQIESLQERLARNSDLLGCAAQGFEDARHLLTRLRTGEETHLYDRHGTAKTMRQVRNQLEHKA